MTNLVDELTKRKVNENTTLENRDVLRKDKGDNNDKVGMAMDVRLDGRESKQHRIALKPRRRTRKAMEEEVPVGEGECEVAEFCGRGEGKGLERNNCGFPGCAHSVQ